MNMNGVRRFLGGGGGSGSAVSSAPGSPSTSPPKSSTIVQPLVISSGRPIWPPSASSSRPSSPAQSSSPGGESPLQSPVVKNVTPALFLRKDKKPSLPSAGVAAAMSSSGSGAAPLNGNNGTHSRSGSADNEPGKRASRPGGLSSPRKPVPAYDFDVTSSPPLSSSATVPPPLPPKRSSGLINTKDELLMSLLSSEAMVDSREYEVLSSEEVDELKREHQILHTRLDALEKKLKLETKIRDAAVSLAKVNASNKRLSKQSDEQVDVANRRVDTAQKEFWRISTRYHDVQRRLLEHRSGVLSLSLRTAEQKLNPNTNDGNGGMTSEGSGYSTPNRSSASVVTAFPSPGRSSVTSASAASAASISSSRFDGAHFFAGHEQAIVPRLPRQPGDFAALEERLRAATDALAAANRRQAETARELSIARLEKEEVQTTMGTELQSAEDTIAALEKELPRFEGLDVQVQELLEEKEQWAREREGKDREIDTLEKRLMVLEEQSGVSAGLEGQYTEQLKQNRLEVERKEQELKDVRVQWERDKEEHAAVSGALRALAATHDIAADDLRGLVEGLERHLNALSVRMDGLARAQQEWEVTRRKLQDDVQQGFDKREGLFRELENARTEIRSLQDRLRDSISASSRPIPQIHIPETMDTAAIVSVLQPLWMQLPSPEARAAKLASSARGGRGHLRNGTSPASNPSSPRTGAGGSVSISDMDVRSLRPLYDGSVNPSSPSPQASTFTLENFVERVQALVADDRLLIERLIRFAQAHELLKRNAERASKLAAESNTGLETYQKQVRSLDERNAALMKQQAALRSEVQDLQSMLDRVEAEKREMEAHAAEQAETCHQLTEANNALSAQTLSLAAEAATAPEQGRRVRQLETQIVELKTQLVTCQADLETTRKELQQTRDESAAMRQMEQTQQSAMLEELNAMQNENGNLRAQLRAVKK